MKIDGSFPVHLALFFVASNFNVASAQDFYGWTWRVIDSVGCVMAPWDTVVATRTRTVTTTHTATATTTTTTTDTIAPTPTSSIPQPRKSFLIREVQSDRYLTLTSGTVGLHSGGERNPQSHWICHERHGWFGFENDGMGGYLGHDNWGILRTQPHHSDWENFSVRQMPDGGYVLLMTEWGKLWPVKIKREGKEQKLAKVEAPVDHGLRWEFIEVRKSS